MDADKTLLPFSPKEQAIIDLLNSRGSMKQTHIISELAPIINSSKAKELLANLVDRHALCKGNDGYELRRFRKNKCLEK